MFVPSLFVIVIFACLGWGFNGDGSSRSHYLRIDLNKMLLLILAYLRIYTT